MQLAQMLLALPAHWPQRYPHSLRLAGRLNPAPCSRQQRQTHRCQRRLAQPLPERPAHWLQQSPHSQQLADRLNPVSCSRQQRQTHRCQRRLAQMLLALPVPKAHHHQPQFPQVHQQHRQWQLQQPDYRPPRHPLAMIVLFSQPFHPDPQVRQVRLQLGPPLHSRQRRQRLCLARQHHRQQHRLPRRPVALAHLHQRRHPDHPLLRPPHQPRAYHPFLHPLRPQQPHHRYRQRLHLYSLQRR